MGYPAQKEEEEGEEGIENEERGIGYRDGWVGVMGTEEVLMMGSGLMEKGKKDIIIIRRSYRQTNDDDGEWGRKLLNK